MLVDTKKGECVPVKKSKGPVRGEKERGEGGRGFLPDKKHVIAKKKGEKKNKRRKRKRKRENLA